MKRIRVRGSVVAVLAALVVMLAAVWAGAAAAQVTVTPVRAAASAVVNMEALARLDAASPAPNQPEPRVFPGPRAPAGPRALAAAGLFTALPAPESSIGGRGITPPSPQPAQTFVGLGGIPNLSTGYVYIPPDTDGAVGLTKIMSGLNNNYRIWTKATGAVLSTVGTNTFWGLSGDGDDYVFDPRTLYDPINDRWIVVMLQASWVDDSSFINIGVSQTSDPSGSYWTFRIDADPHDALWADFPTVGFNKDYVAVNVNMYDPTTWETNTSTILAVDYRALRSGTWHGWFIDGTGNTSAPAATYSATESTLYVPAQSKGNPGVYRVDKISGDPSRGPVYTVGSPKWRGLSWTTPDGNILPQKPTAAVPDPVGLEAADDMIGTTPVVRDGFIYYVQAVSLPAGAATHTSILWTKLSAATGDVADGGLIDDPTATATNGGKWYSYPHIAVNKAGDVIVGFSQFSSTQWPSAGYAVRMSTDPPGTMRLPVVYKAGEDLYQADYGSGRYRWGDYSKAQVDPSNDADLWVVNEYAALNDQVPDYGGVWGTWWARVAPLSVAITPSVAGGLGTVSPAGVQAVAVGSTPTFTFRPAANFHVQTVTVDGAPVTMTGPDSYTFPPVSANHTITVTFATDVTCAVTALPVTAGGTVTPLGTTNVPFTGSVTISVVPDPHYHIERVTIDGNPVTPRTSYTLTFVTTRHRLEASFALDAYAVTPSVVAGSDRRAHGSISPATSARYVWGSTPAFRFSPEPGYVVFEVRVDGVQLLPTPRTSFTFARLTGPHTISVRFAKGFVPGPQ